MKKPLFKSDQLEHFNTDLEKKLWAMVVKLEISLAKECLDKANRTREEPTQWPAGMVWKGMVGSSHSIFFKRARELAGVDSEEYLDLVRNNADAGEIASDIYEESIK